MIKAQKDQFLIAIADVINTHQVDRHLSMDAEVVASAAFDRILNKKSKEDNMKKQKNDQVWVDNITGLQMTKNNAKEMAAFVGGEVVGGDNVLVAMPTPRGEMIVRPGDWVGQDQANRWHLIRCSRYNNNSVPKPGPRK